MEKVTMKYIVTIVFGGMILMTSSLLAQPERGDRSSGPRMTASKAIKR